MARLVLVRDNLEVAPLVAQLLQEHGHEMRLVSSLKNISEALLADGNIILIARESKEFPENAWNFANQIADSDYKTRVGVIILLESLTQLKKNSDLYSHSALLDIVTMPMDVYEILARITMFETHFAKTLK